MAMNTFDALMAEVNQKISQADTAASQANAAAASANAAGENAQEKAQDAQTAAQEARTAAQQADAMAAAWENVTVQAQTAQAGSEAGVTLTKTDGARVLSFVIPRGADGATGAKGDTGRSGVTFTLSGTNLYITTS